MEQEFVQEEFEAVRQTVDALLGVSSKLRRRTKKNEDKQREYFLQIIRSLEIISTRSNLLYADYKLDLANYEEPFMEVIDLLLISKYGRNGYDLISFYLWERVNPDLTLNALIGPDGAEIVLETPLDLWNLLIRISPVLEK